MTDQMHSGPHDGSRTRAFTLIEIVVSLTILAVIAAIAIPTMKGMNREEKARERITSLAEVVQEASHRAMRERRTYQIVFEPEGIHASPAMYPYEKREDFLQHLEELRTPPPMQEIERTGVERQRDPGAPPEPVPVEPPWTVSIPLEQGTECGVLMWGDGEWDVLDGGKMRRWVFQPAGMTNPARIRLRSGDRETEAGFDVLTGELTSEHTHLLTQQP